MISEKIKVLLVEDNDGDVMLVEELLDSCEGKNKVEVCHADSILNAIDRLSRNKFDVIFLDLNLPDGTGEYTLSKIKASAGEIPIIILTGSTLKRDELRDCILNTEQYLVKGYIDADSLSYTLHSALKEK